MAFWLGQRDVFAIAVGFAAALPACNEADPASEDAARLVATFCESAERCSCAADLAAGDCVEHRTSIWNERIAEGRRRQLTYDVECFEAQVDAAVEHGCWSADKFEPHLCESYCAVFHGNNELGDDCDGYDEVVSDCAQGLLCSEGSCVSPCARLTGLPPGERCMTDEGIQIEECADGLECSWETKTCLTLPAIGQPCSGACEYGAFCDYYVSVCVAVIGEGGDCREAQCAADLYCQYNYDGVTETAVCLRYAVEGEVCANAQCGPGLGCAADSVCRGPGELGEPCNGSGCVEGLLCEYMIDQCIAPPAEAGQLCPLGECGSGLWCDNSTVPEGVCQPEIVTGERCSGHAQCESGYCPAAFCIERPGVGEDCMGAGLCQHGLTCDGLVCVEAAEAGPAACSYRGW